jgi:hypothetical protein
VTYDPLPTTADLCVVSLEYALEVAELRLHVHPLYAARARDIISSYRIAENCIRKSVVVVPDDSLNNNEWYVKMAMGSNPA